MENNLMVFSNDIDEGVILKYVDYVAMSMGSNLGRKVKIDMTKRMVISECGSSSFYFRRLNPRLMDFLKSNVLELAIFNGCLPDQRILSQVYSKTRNIEIYKELMGR